MESGKWRQIDSLLHSALERPSSERNEFLREACAGDETLESEVRSLLAASQEAGSFLESPAMEAAAQALAIQQMEAASNRAGDYGNTPVRLLPAQLGRYRIVRLLGEGGMGVVYEAVQERPHRTVALKVVKPGLDASLLRRFEHESEALARLQHPGIAQIFEAGVADAGFGPQPYFAMEFIRGETLRDYVEARHLDVRERLSLIVKICQAVEHAHQRGLIHRDLKPGNILVDETGQPKILDFGVARVADTESKVTRQTDIGQLVGTLEYMSPEQVLADPEEIDTRSDVYALGVILYEILAGRRPYKLSRQLHEAVRTIREEDPAPLSSVSRDFRGDIETIAAKSLEKDKARRYGSATALAADIERHLNDEPITARPASTTYQLRKFARRHKALAGSVAAVFLVLAAGIVASTWEAVRANRAQRAAESQAAIAKAVNDFLENDLLSQASAYNQAHPGSEPDPDLKVRTALDRAAAGIVGKFAARPAVEASIRQTIGSAYWDLGLFAQAQPQIEQAIALRRRVLGEEHLDTLASMTALAGLNREQGKFGPAEALYTKLLDIRRRKLGPEHRDTLASAAGLAKVYVVDGKDRDAEPLLTKTLEIRRRVLGPNDPDTLDTMNSLSVVYTDQGKYDRAEPLLLELLETDRRVLGADHPVTLTSMSGLAWVYIRQGRYAQAEPVALEALERRRRALGEEHPDTLKSMVVLARIFTFEGKYAPAERLYTTALRTQRRLLGVNNPDTGTSMNNLGALYTDEGKYAQAESLLLEVLKVYSREGEQHPDTLAVLTNLGSLYRRTKQYERASDVYARAIEGWRRALGPDHPLTAGCLDVLGWIRLQQGRYVEAEGMFRQALDIQQKASPATWQRWNSESLLGASLEREGKYAAAEQLLRSGYEGMKQRETSIPFYNKWALDEARANVIRLYLDTGKPDKAVEWRRKLNSNSTTGPNN